MTVCLRPGNFKAKLIKFYLVENADYNTWKTGETAEHVLMDYRDMERKEEDTENSSKENDGDD